jgi:hypothetical protein
MGHIGSDAELVEIRGLVMGHVIWIRPKLRAVNGILVGLCQLNHGVNGGCEA